MLGQGYQGIGALGALAQGQAAAQNNYAPAAPKPISQMQEHANKLHDQASRLAECNARLAALLERAAGAEPKDGSAAADPTPPVGTLYVAQFGAERISIGVDRLVDLIDRLEKIV